MTLTGIVADLPRSSTQAVFRRILAVATMLAGAVASELLVLHSRLTSGLGVALVLLAVVVVVCRHDPQQAN